MDIYDFVLGCSDAISCDKFAGVNNKFFFEFSCRRQVIMKLFIPLVVVFVCKIAVVQGEYSFVAWILRIYSANYAKTKVGFMHAVYCVRN